jgi:hypothetical protein
MPATKLAQRIPAVQERTSVGKLFVVDVDARLLKRNVDVSKGARCLHGTMRALADRRTGKLAIGGKSLDWQTICRQAEISHCTWRKYRRELLAVGLLWEQRDREAIYDHKAGRMRVVLGKTTYCVRLQTAVRKTVKNSTNLLGANSSTVEELAPQYVQNTTKPYGAIAFAVRPALEPVLEPLSISEPQSSSPAPTATADDDDSSVIVSEPSKRNSLTDQIQVEDLEKAIDTFMAESGLPFNVVTQMIDIIEKRSAQENISNVYKYFLKSLRVFDRDEVAELLHRANDEQRRVQPDQPELTLEQQKEAHRSWEINYCVKESQRTGYPADLLRHAGCGRCDWIQPADPHNAATCPFCNGNAAYPTGPILRIQWREVVPA